LIVAFVVSVSLSGVSILTMVIKKRRKNANPTSTQGLQTPGINFQGTKKCVQCGSINPANYNFCKSCGVQLPDNNNTNIYLFLFRFLCRTLCRFHYNGEIGSAAVSLRLSVGWKDCSAELSWSWHVSGSKVLVVWFVVLPPLPANQSRFSLNQKKIVAYSEFSLM